MMKGFVCALVLALAVVCVSAGAVHEEWKKLKDECKAEVGITEELPKDTKPNFEDSKVRCLFACIMEKKGTLKDGKIDADKAIEHFVQWKPETDENAKTKLRECATEANKKTEKCDVAGDYSKCAMEAVPHEKKE